MLKLKIKSISKLWKIFIKREDLEAEDMTMNGNLRKPTKICWELILRQFLLNIWSKLLKKNHSGPENSSLLIESSEMKPWIILIWQNFIRLKGLSLTETWDFSILLVFSQSSTKKLESKKFGSNLPTTPILNHQWKFLVIILLLRTSSDFEEKSWNRQLWNFQTRNDKTNGIPWRRISDCLGPKLGETHYDSVWSIKHQRTFRSWS